MKKIIFNPENPNGLTVDLTGDELAKSEAMKQEDIAKDQAEATAKQAEATNKANGNQKLLDLGLTQAEATALTGYTPPEAE
jgi:hypothetical protein